MIISTLVFFDVQKEGSKKRLAVMCFTKIQLYPERASPSF